MSEEEQGKFAYGLSNPLIKKCYDVKQIEMHQHMGFAGEQGDFGLTYFPEGRTTTLPGPRYTHKR